MSETKNLKLKKHDNPETNTEKFDIENYLNGNWDKVDENVGKTNTEISNVKAKNTEQDSKIVILQNEKEELENELKEVKEDNYQNSIRGQASGEYIHVEDSSNCRGKIGLSGNSEQETRSGKNLLNIYSEKKVGDKIVSNGITATIAENGKIILNGEATTNAFIVVHKNIKLSAGTYTESANNIDAIGSINFSESYMTIRLMKNNGIDIVDGSNKCNLANKNAINTFTIKEDTEALFQIRIGQGLILNNFEIQPQIEKKSTSTDFEEYGAMPSPDYPSEIKAVNGYVKVTKCNKNKMDLAKCQLKTLNGVTSIYNKETNSITFSGICTTDTTTFYVLSSENTLLSNISIQKNSTLLAKYISGNVSGTAEFRCSDENWNHKIVLNLTTINTTNKTVYKTYNGDNIDGTYLSFRFNKGTVLNNFTVQLMLTDTVDTDYIQHEEETYNMPLQQAFKAIGNIRDTFIKINGKWYERHNITRKILDGTENWMLIDNNSRFAIKITEQKAKIDVKDSNNNLTDCLSNRLINSTQLDIAKVTNGIAFSQWADTQYLYLSKIKDSIDELKKYLAENETYVDYPLEVPLDIECTSEQSAVLEKLNNARTYKNITNLYSTNEVSAILSLDYAKDLEILLNNVQALALNSSEGV